MNKIFLILTIVVCFFSYGSLLLAKSETNHAKSETDHQRDPHSKFVYYNGDIKKVRLVKANDRDTYKFIEVMCYINYGSKLKILNTHSDDEQVLVEMQDQQYEHEIFLCNKGSLFLLSLDTVRSYTLDVTDNTIDGIDTVDLPHYVYYIRQDILRISPDPTQITLTIEEGEIRPAPSMPGIIPPECAIRYGDKLQIMSFTHHEDRFIHAWLAREQEIEDDNPHCNEIELFSMLKGDLSINKKQ